MRIINSEVKRSTGHSPAQLLFGNAIDLQREILKSKVNTKEVIINHEYFKNLVAQQSILLDIAESTQRENDLYHLKVRASTTGNPNENNVITENSYVLWNDPAKSPTKLEYHWLGPFLVQRKEGDIVTLECIITHKTWKDHVTRVRPFLHDSKFGFPTPEEQAAHDLNEFFVEEILDHRILKEKKDRHKTSSYEFKVKWLGFPNQDSWEPYEVLRDNQQFHNYVLNNADLKPIHSRVKKHVLIGNQKR
jgi:hypothetical protein